jgi:ABC-2 type transport system ATP-binding protein
MSNMIVVQDLVKNYGDICAVNHISFTVPEGKIFGSLGPNGAGKTNSTKMLTTVLDPTSGTIRVNDHDPVREQKQMRRSSGIVFQDVILSTDRSLAHQSIA